MASENEWTGNVIRLKELVCNDDPREFTRWDVIQNTMCVNYASYLTSEFKYLKRHPDWENRWRPAIKESAVGHPIPHWQYPKSSGNLIHHAYHIAQFEDTTATRVDSMDFVFEFGGGYGSMCRLLYNLGFNGSYVIFDLPAFSLLQQFYLKAIGVTVHTPESFKNATSGALCISDVGQMKEIISNMPKSDKSLFIATWSLSETPIEFRKSVVPLLSSFKTFLIGYQAQFNEVNNIEFFNEWKSIMSGVEWQDGHLKHIQGHNRYLMGKAKIV
jgi:hypothetical protein